jgi:hypothetical protein
MALNGLHALARWYQRSFHNDQATLLNDIGALIRADNNSQRVDCRDGWWVTKAITGPGDQILLRAVSYLN